MLQVADVGVGELVKVVTCVVTTVCISALGPIHEKYQSVHCPAGILIVAPALARTSWLIEI